MPTSSFITPTLETDFSGDWSQPELLYTGEYNAIYCATRFGKRYVLKTLRDEYKQSLPHQELLKKEFLLGLPLDHPNIVKTLDWGQMEDIGNYIQLEYIDGVTLSAFLETHPSSKIKKQILQELLVAVEYLHQHQTIHRDIKPSNILITRNGHHVKLIDLGIADADDYVALKQPAGSFAFIAPEQMAGEVIDGRADVYSIGKVMQLLFAHQYRLVARKCTANNREKRYSSCARILHAVNRVDRLRKGLPLVLLIGSIAALLTWQLTQWKECSVPQVIHSTDTITIVQHESTLEVESLQQKLDSLQTWTRIPSDEEKDDFHQQVISDIRQYEQQLILDAQTGKLDHITNRKSFCDLFDQWCDAEKSKIHNQYLLEIFTNACRSDISLNITCEYVYTHLPNIPFEDRSHE